MRRIKFYKMQHKKLPLNIERHLLFLIMESVSKALVSNTKIIHVPKDHAFFRVYVSITGSSQLKLSDRQFSKLMSSKFLCKKGLKLLTC